jgi:hypothetical protein
VRPSPPHPTGPPRDVDRLSIMSDTASDQSLGERGERARGSVRETQAPGFGRVAVERRQFRIGVQLAHLHMDIVIDPLEKVERGRDILEVLREHRMEAAEQVHAERAHELCGRNARFLAET